MSIGTLTHPAMLERWMMALLNGQMPAYLAEVAAQNDINGAIRQPRTIKAAGGLEKWPEDQLPALIVVSPGLRQEPTGPKDGWIAATWILSVAAVVSAATQIDARYLASLYGAAIRGAVMQNRTLGSGRQDVRAEWANEDLDEIAPEDNRTLTAALEIFNVHVSRAVCQTCGPAEPPEGPWLIDTVIIDIDKKELTEP